VENTGGFITADSGFANGRPDHCVWRNYNGWLEPTEDGVQIVREVELAVVTDVDESACKNLKYEKSSELEWLCIKRTVKTGKRIDTE
jgi:hypothetical protein